MWTSVADAELTRLREAGLTFGRIAEQMGVTRSAAISRFQRINGKKYGPGKPVLMRKYLRAELRERQARELEQLRAEFTELAGKDRVFYILVAHATGLSKAAIGRAAGLSRERVRQIVSSQFQSEQQQEMKPR
jgi:hypothetical protein